MFTWNLYRLNSNSALFNAIPTAYSMSNIRPGGALSFSTTDDSDNSTESEVTDTNTTDTELTNTAPVVSNDILSPAGISESSAIEIERLNTESAASKLKIAELTNELEIAKSDVVTGANKEDSTTIAKALVEAEERQMEERNAAAARDRLELDVIAGKHDGLVAVIKPAEFPLMVDTERLIEESEELFDRLQMMKGKNEFPDLELSHLELQEDAVDLRKNSDMYVKWNISQGLYKRFMNGVYKAASSGKPVSPYYIQSLERALMAKDDAIGLPVFNMHPSGRQVAAKAAFGAAHGAFDLVHFMPSQFETITVQVRVVMDPKSSNHKYQTVRIVAKSHDGDKTMDQTSERDFNVYDINQPDMAAKNNKYSMFGGKANTQLFPRMYETNGKGKHEDDSDTNWVDVGLMHDGETERRAIIIKDDSGETVFAQGYQIPGFLLEGLRIPVGADGIMSQLTPLFHLKELYPNKSDQNEFLAYVGTGVMKFVSDTVKLTASNKINYMHVNLEIKRKIPNEELMDTFRDYVNEGFCMPLTPLQFQVYFGLQDLSDWTEFAYLSALSMPNYNTNFDSLMPNQTLAARAAFAFYARNREYLTSDAYTPSTAIPMKMSQKFGIDWNMFMKELYVRTLLNKPLPDYIYPLTAGAWNICGAPNKSVGVAALHPMFCKLEMSDYPQGIDHFVKDMLLINSDMNYIHKNCRLTEFLPDVYCRYVPGKDGWEAPNESDNEDNPSWIISGHD